MEELTPEIARLFTAKEERRLKLAALPFPDKVRIVVRMQEMTVPLLRARGRRVSVWSLHPPAMAEPGQGSLLVRATKVIE